MFLSEVLDDLEALSGGPTRVTTALRRVAEIHRPVRTVGLPGCAADETPPDVPYWLDDGIGGPYPCPTILAVCDALGCEPDPPAPPEPRPPSLSERMAGRRAANYRQQAR